MWRSVWPIAPAALVLRLFPAWLPLATLWVSKLLPDAVAALARGKVVNPRAVWTLVALEFGLAILSDILGRLVTLCDSLLSDRFTNRISVRLMKHAARLDLTMPEPCLPGVLANLQVLAGHLAIVRAAAGGGEAKT